jgi:hypothetical protein
MTGEERKMCQSDFVLEAQLKLQAASIQARASSDENRLRLDETRVLLDEKRLQYEKNLAFARDHRENITFVHNLQKYEARTLPQDKKSLMVALIILASLLAVVILNAAFRSNQCAPSVPLYRSCSRLRTD